MGRRGPPPEPTALRLIKGNTAHRPLPPNEPEGRHVRPTCPKWLTPAAKKYWRDVVPKLERMRVLTDDNAGALAALCQSFARWQEAEAVLTDQGTTYEALKYVDKDDIAYTVEKARPQVKIAKDEKAAFIRISLEFGLTPSAKTRVKAAPADTANDDALLNRRKA